MVLGLKVLLRGRADSVLEMVKSRAPIKPSGRIKGQRSHKARSKPCELVLECSNLPDLFEAIDKVWRKVSGAVSRRRIAKTALCLGLDSMAKVDHGKVRQLVSRVCPVPKKYWDTEVGAWL